MADPQQELFSSLKTGIKAKGYDVYDGFLPPDGTPYPFIYLGDCQQTDTFTKSDAIGYVYQTIHVWSNNPKKRGTVSKILADIKNSCGRINNTENYAWYLRNVTQRIIPDDTTSTPLLHGIIEAEFRFS